jgi:hypothetical protein
VSLIPIIIRGGHDLNLIKFEAQFARPVLQFAVYEFPVGAIVRPGCACGTVTVLTKAPEEV